MYKPGDIIDYKMPYSGKIMKMRIDEVVPDEYYKGNFIYHLRNPKRPKTDINGVWHRIETPQEAL